ncbi:MAG: HD domain-containing protein [Planctomycetota bacterium]
MENTKLRRQIAHEAARLMYQRQESEYLRAKMKAARRLLGGGRGWVKPADLPSNAEVRDQVLVFARLYEGDARTADLQAMRLAALRLMQTLAAFRPRLIGSVLTGHVREGSDIDLHVFSDSVEAITHVLEREGLAYRVERKQVRKGGEQQTFRHIHVDGHAAGPSAKRWPVELTVYAARQAHHVFKSSITGRAIERASVKQLRQRLAVWYPAVDLDAELADAAAGVDRFQLFEAILLPLESVVQRPDYHPEGDALYHSLQVFDLARDALPYDEEFLTAALLHDVGKGVDAADHVAAGLEALGGSITGRTAWLIAHHMEAHKIADGTIGRRRLRRLRQDESYAELVLLGECDRGGRVPGADAPELDEALDYLRELSHWCG